MEHNATSPLTLAAALVWATNELRGTSATPRLDAELLLAHTLGWSRARLLSEGRAPLPEAAHATFRVLIGRRAALEPVAYLVGEKEFYGLVFNVDRRVLVPRPETELLVERALDIARRSASHVRIADIGTGSGCIAVALAVHLLTATVQAVDISPDALLVAASNVQRHHVAARVRLLRGDLLASLPAPVDIVVSNPPYTVLDEIDANVRLHEPHLALDGGPDGLAPYRRLLADAPAVLRPGGAVLLEIGATQGAAVAALARAHFPTACVNIYQDLAGLDRVVQIETKTNDE